MREHKYKAWHKAEKVMCDVSIINFGQGAFLVGVKKGEDEIGDKYFIPAPTDGRFCDFDEFELLQYTGLKDKNGKEIYKGDVLRIKHKIGENEIHYVDALYAVEQLTYMGLSMRCVKPAMSEDSNNQYPICPNLSVRYGQLREDYANSNYENIAILDTWGENHIFKNQWRENHYSNDIEIIANIHENLELIN